MTNDVLSFTLRSAGPADAAALARLGRESFTAKFGHLYKPEDLADFLDEKHSETAVAAELADPARACQLAARDGALLGYIKLGFATSFPEHVRGERPVELKQLYTAPDATGRGIGAALIAWALAEARTRGCDEMQLSVWSGNDGAQRFYARYGFVKVADVDFWVGDQCDDEFLMALML